MVQIKMAMPKCCYKCRMLFLASYVYRCCLTWQKPTEEEKREKRPEWCPLKEVKKNA